MGDAALTPLPTLIEAHRPEIRDIAVRHRGLRVAVIGSVARQEETPRSDIDFLVEFEGGSSLFDLVRARG